LLLLIAPAAAKVPQNTVPRLLEEEGFYVGTRPYVSPQNLNRMENRLLKEATGGNVTQDEEAVVGDSETAHVRYYYNYFAVWFVVNQCKTTS